MYDTLEDINAYFVNGNAYCQYCFVQLFFDGDENMLRTNIENSDFHTLTGMMFSLLHVDSIQSADNDIPVEGVYCSKCLNCCIEPNESDTRKHTFFFNEEQDMLNCQKYCIREYTVLDDNTRVDTDEITQYELSFFTYQPLNNREIKYMARTFNMSTYEVNVPEERW